jgi:hypothetical protein
MTHDDVRRLALALPEAVESAHVGRPDFRVRGKIFATLRAEETGAVVKLTREQQDILASSEPGVFTGIPGGWGFQGWTAIDLDSIDEVTLRSSLLMAWRNVAPKRLVAKSS